MRSQITFLIFLLWSGIFVGCSSSKHLGSSSERYSSSGSQIETSVDRMVQELRLQVVNSSKKTLAVLPFEFQGKEGTGLQRWLLEKFTEELGKFSHWDVIRHQTVLTNLANLKIFPNGLFKFDDARKEFVKTASFVLRGKVEDSGEFLNIEVDIVDLLSLRTIKSSKVSVTKDVALMRILNEPIPAKLIVSTLSDEASVIIDEEFKGIATVEGLQLKIPAGEHNVRIERNDFVRLEKKMILTENEFERLTVRFESKSGTHVATSLLLGAVAPGLPAWHYSSGDPERGYEFGKAAAIIFYGAGVCYAIDALYRPHFFTQNSESSYKKWKNVELYTMAAAYGLNVISSLVIGLDQVGRDKHIEEVAEGNSASNLKLSISSMPLKVAFPAQSLTINFTLSIR